MPSIRAWTIALVIPIVIVVLATLAGWTSTP